MVRSASVWASLRRRPLLGLEIAFGLAALATLGSAVWYIDPTYGHRDPTEVVRDVAVRLDYHGSARLFVGRAERFVIRELPGQCFQVLDGGALTHREDGSPVFMSSGTRLLRGGHSIRERRLVRVLDGPAAGTLVEEPWTLRGDFRRSPTREGCSEDGLRRVQLIHAAAQLPVEVPTI